MQTLAATLSGFEPGNRNGANASAVTMTISATVRILLRGRIAGERHHRLVTG